MKVRRLQRAGLAAYKLLTQLSAIVYRPASAPVHSL